MATPFVPVPVPIDRALPGSSNARRPKRASSAGSVSSSSESSSTKGTAEDSSFGRSDNGSCFIASCPVTRARINEVESTVEYSSCTRPDTPPHTLGWEERPITPTVLGYEVMEERAKFTVRLMLSVFPVMLLTKIVLFFLFYFKEMFHPSLSNHVLGPLVAIRCP